MPRLSKQALITFAAATLAGACLHVLYTLLPNPVTAVLAPVSQSLWEHLKLLFWPFLASMLLLTRRGEKGCKGPWLAALLLVCLAMLAVGYVYHVAMGRSALAFDVGLYVLLMGAGFLLAELLDRPKIRARTDLFILLTLALGLAMLLFTFLPPDHILFADLTHMNTWGTIPY